MGKLKVNASHIDTLAYILHSTLYNNGSRVGLTVPKCTNLDKHVAYLRESYNALLNYYVVNKKAKDHAKLLRWDLMWCFSQKSLTSNLFKTIYEYANDSHIDSALIHILDNIEKYMCCNLYQAVKKIDASLL